MVVILWAAKSSVNTFVQVNSYKWAFYELYGTIFVSTLHNTGHELKDDWDMVVGGRRSINGPKILVKDIDVCFDWNYTQWSHLKCFHRNAPNKEI